MIDLLAIALHIYGETGNEPKIQNSDLTVLTNLLFSSGVILRKESLKGA